MFRVAALQFAPGTEVEENLAHCQRLLEEVVRLHRPHLVVLPAFSNHPAEYTDLAHARHVAVTLEGPFVSALAEAARRHGVHLAVHLSLLKEQERLTATSLLLGPNGETLAATHAALLRERLVLHFDAQRDPTPTVVQTPQARLAAYAPGEQAALWPRALAVHGAELLCLHGHGGSRAWLRHEAIACAAENGVFVVAAGYPELAEEGALAGDATTLLVAPGGQVITEAPGAGEGSVVAELDLAAVQPAALWPRRPELYRGLGIRGRPREGVREACPLDVVLAPAPEADSAEAALERGTEWVRGLSGRRGALVILPELFCFSQGIVESPEQAADLFPVAARRLCEACAESGVQLVTSLLERTSGALFHMGLLLGPRGVIARQAQLHVPARHAWATPGRRLESVRLPWGTLTIAVGDDARSPELRVLAGLLGASLVVCPFAAPTLPWESDHAARAFAAATGISVAATGHAPGQAVLVDAAEPKGASEALQQAGAGALWGNLRFKAGEHPSPALDVPRALWEVLTRRPPMPEVVVASEASAQPAD